MNNVMIDIETLGTEPGCVILSIGAVEFDDNKLGQEFEINIDPESCTKAGLHIDPRTVIWWMGQSEEAREKIIRANTVALDKALVEFVKAFDWEGKKVWCNGASFDFPILQSAFSALGGTSPWQYWNAMDYRTLKNLIDTKTLKQIRSKIINPVKHSALDDAKEQALTTIAILKFLRGE